MGGSNFVSPASIPDFINDGLSEAAINISATGTVVAPVSGKRISVFALHVVTNGSVAMTAQDVTGAGGAGGNTVSITGPMTFLNGQPLVLPHIGYPWWTVAPGDALQFNVGAITSVTMAGRIIYMQG
jgi:hypothetical protein